MPRLARLKIVSKILYDLRLRWELYRMNRSLRRAGTSVEQLGRDANKAGVAIRGFILAWERMRREEEERHRHRCPDSPV